MTYLDPDVLTDEGALAEALLAAVADQIPGWQPSEGHVETSLAEAMAVVTAAMAILMLDAERDSYSGFGTNILGIPRRPETAAEAASTWTMRDDAGYLVPDGTQVIMRAADGSSIAFALAGDLTIPAGRTSADEIRVVALETGPAANGLAGVAQAVDAVPGVLSVALTSTSAGGADVEPIADYVNRLADRARRLRTIPVVPGDYAAIATDHPAVARTMAVNLLDLGSGSGSGDDPDAPGHITVFPIDAAGQPISGSAAAEVQALLTGDERPLNVTVHVGAPTYTSVSVTLTIRIADGADPGAMTTVVEQALADYLDPAAWALDETAEGRWRAPRTDSERTITRFDVARVADLVPGVVSVMDAAVNGGASVYLSGFAPLPQPGAVVVSVSS